jgi:glycerol 2-dehydrogenase (NADP+)
MADNTFILNTGAKIPALGFGKLATSVSHMIIIMNNNVLGTWQAAPGEVAKAVEHALKSGYRHVDAAYAYSNEEEVGLGLKKAFESGIKREDVFVTTKLWSTYHRRVQENLELSLAKLGLDYVDLYLMHWPVALNPNGNSLILHLNMN